MTTIGEPICTRCGRMIVSGMDHIDCKPQQPNPYYTGYTCPVCGYWIEPHSFHQCPGPQPAVTPVIIPQKFPVPLTYLDDLERALELLRELVRTHRDEVTVNGDYQFFDVMDKAEEFLKKLDSK